MTNSTSVRFNLALALAVLASALANTQLLGTGIPVANPDRVKAKTDQTPRLLSAFFGLDNGVRGNRICPDGAGQDGMPIVLSHIIDPGTLQPEDFRVFARSGAESIPLCVSLLPANDPGERRTVLLIGEFGNADKDPPMIVRVVGDILSKAKTGTTLNFSGLETHVIPLESGPTLVLAEVVSIDEWSIPGRGSPCPKDSLQVIRVTWAGGVRLPGGGELGDDERPLYRVTVERPNGSHEEIAPAALAELGDRDNNHFLCLDTTDPAVSVSFPAGHLVDPNQDLNPYTRIAVINSPNAE